MALVVAQQTKPAAPDAASVEKALVGLRADLQADRADVMAKNISLTAAQAAKFWPMFEAYQKEQNLIMDEQLKGLQRFADNYATLNDAGALDLLKTHLDRDDKMTALRRKWLGEFQTVLGAKLAVRVLQIDRRLSNAHQVMFSTQIPLVY